MGGGGPSHFLKQKPEEKDFIFIVFFFTANQMDAYFFLFVLITLVRVDPEKVKKKNCFVKRIKMDPLFFFGNCICREKTKIYPTHATGNQTPKNWSLPDVFEHLKKHTTIGLY